MRALGVLICGALLIASCANDNSPVDVAVTTEASGPSVGTSDPASETPEATNPTATSGSNTSLSTPDTAAPPITGQTIKPGSIQREILDWYIEVLNGRVAITVDTYQEHFSKTFREELSFDAFGALISQLTPVAPYTIDRIESDGNTGLAAILLANDGTTLRVRITVNTSGTVDDLMIEPIESLELDTPPTTLHEAISQLEEYGNLQWVAARVNNVGGMPICNVIDGDQPRDLTPIASAFKLYVLGALADQIVAETISWDTELRVRSNLKSLPSGILQDRPDGSLVRVEEAAQLMIEISDNTATDILIDALGRQLIEEKFAQWGHHDPAANIPLLTTREMFALKAADRSTQDEYLAAAPDIRRQMLPNLGNLALEAISVEDSLTKPNRPTEIEWFASPLDLCNALARLVEVGRTNDSLEPVERALTSNPGAESERWPTVAYKSGNEPGLVTMVWVMEDDEGQQWSFVASLVNEDELLDSAQIPLLMAAARDLVAIDTETSGAALKSAR